MPRKRNPEKEANRAYTEAWRKRLSDARRPEVDAVDTALSVAVAVLAEVAATKGSDADRTRVSGIEIMAVNWLVSRGLAREHAMRSVGRRVHRMDVQDIIPLVSGRPTFARSNPFQK